MKKVIRLTESDLTRIIQRIINESTEGIEPFIEKILQTYDSPELREHIDIIRNFIEASGCKKIEIVNLMGGALGMATHNGILFSPKIFGHSLENFLFIIFHELTHQYQFKKYGVEAIYDYYLGDIDVKDAAISLKQIEVVADELATRKVRQFIKLGVINKKQAYMLGVYKHQSLSYFEQMLTVLKKKLKEENITDIEQVADFFNRLVQQPFTPW